jgi:hypothetical protein
MSNCNCKPALSGTAAALDTTFRDGTESAVPTWPASANPATTFCRTIMPAACFASLLSAPGILPSFI